MIKTITQNKLILFLYGETSNEESSVIEETIKSDWDVQEHYNALLENKLFLDSAIQQPRKIAVRRILEYSSANAHHEHSH